MSNKYLVLKFKDARLFRKLRPIPECRDYSFTSYGEMKENLYTKRINMPIFIEPITVHQISNMIHALFNERPVSSLRKSLYPRNEYYFEKAQNSYLKITTPKINKGDFFYEIIQSKKAVWNSWNTAITLNWKMIEAYINNKEKFDNLCNLLSASCKIDVRKIPFIDLINMVQSLEKEDRLSLYKQIGGQRIDGIIYAFGRYTDNKFTDSDVTKITNTPNRVARTVNRGIEKFISLSGEIIIPVSDDDIEKLSQVSKGTATLLDGGFVWIDSIKDANNILIENFILVKNISTEMTTSSKLKK